MSKCLALILALVWTSGCASGAAFDHSHTLYAKVLKQFSRGGLVDYAGLKTSSGDLDAYLNGLGSVSKSEFNQWHKGQQIAFLLNVYNASVLKLVSGSYPVRQGDETGESGVVSMKSRQVRLFGKKVSLDLIQNQMLRTEYPEPRIHFALAPGSLGSPMLREEPYVPDRLDVQLAEQARRFMSNPAKNRIDPREHVIYLSPIFKWYAGDFEKVSGSIVKYISQFFPPPVRGELTKSKFEIRYTDYDWALNDANPAPAKEAAQLR